MLSNCQTTKEESQNVLIDVETPTKSLSLVGDGVIATPLYERDMAISPKGDELIYTLGDYKQHRRSLVIIKKDKQGWRKPKLLNISGRYQDIEPFYANNGNRLYFASNRPIYGDKQRSDYNIWYSDRQNNVWLEPVALDSVINTKGNEFYPSLSNNGNLYFTATRDNGVGREDIYIAEFSKGIYKTPKALPEEINSKLFEFNAYISPDEKLLVFSSFGRKDGFGGGDLYVSRKDKTGQWQKASNMGAIVNSKALDYCPYIDWRSGNFYFTSERELKDSLALSNIQDLKGIANSVYNGFGNIYKIDLSALKLIKN